MKKRLMELAMACLLLAGFFCLSREAARVSSNMIAQSSSEEAKVIVVDPGHGGVDPGMIGENGLEEKGINLAISLKLRDVLENRGFQVVMTREEDCALSDENSTNQKAQDMQRRIALIDEAKPLLTVSIHQNSYQDEAVYGPQVFYYQDSAEGEQLAGILQETLNTALSVEHPRESKGNRSYYLLKRSQGTLVIVECGFLTNPDEAALLQTEDYQQKVAEAVADGIEEYAAQKEKQNE